ncbi:hypothetical protein PIB30_057320 [Stylosanthes scabra]|uniref:Uncharacterized protein n=1 Tax=Stylosanthes scabra TaxID=79078 RepID=A0ABU6RKE3_9FABA|nr:hypothetical protein [Stylosanthes scabra]
MGLPYVGPKPTNGLNPLRTHTKSPQHRLPDPYKISLISAPIWYGFATQDQDHIYSDLVRIYPKIIGTTTEAPKSLFGDLSSIRYHSFIVTPSLLPWHLQLLRKSQNP